MKQFKHKKVAVLAAIGVLGVGGVMGASAFFTDTAKTVDQVNVGTFNMVLNDYSDLDGNYRTWTADGASTFKLTNSQRMPWIKQIRLPVSLTLVIPESSSSH